MKRPLFHRRKFLTTSSSAAAALLLHRSAFAQPAPVPLHIDTAAAGHLISPDFIGLSYENMQLEDPSFFSPRNTGLIEQFKAISPRGVLRLGGNTSEFSWWQATPSQRPPERNLVLPNGSRPQSTLYAITPQTIRELNGFLKATGWTCIYGLNLGFGSPVTDIPEAQYVSATLGPRLQYFQIGNEVDQFIQYHLRDGETWTPDLYLQQWLTIAQAVQKSIPNARFGLPDVASEVDWLTRIAQLWPSVTDKPKVTTLSHHYYWSGPPSNPRATIPRLLQTDPAVARKAALARQASARLGTTFRMTEGNTVYRGGKSGLSDVFASALWAADYLLTLMQLGYSGVNLHGGSGHAQAVSVGGTFVGEAEMKDPNQPHPKPFYTPIANRGTLAGRGVNGKLSPDYLLEPTGYGMTFVSSFAGATMLPVNFDPGPINAVAYAARTPGHTLLLIILNKDQTQPLTIQLPPCTLHQVLTASSLTTQEAHLLQGPAASALVPIRNATALIPAATGATFLLT